MFAFETDNLASSLSTKKGSNKPKIQKLLGNMSKTSEMKIKNFVDCCNQSKIFLGSFIFLHTFPPLQVN